MEGFGALVMAGLWKFIMIIDGSRKVLSLPLLGANTCVSELISASRGWNLTLLRLVFSYDKAEIISSIQIGG